MQVGGSSPAEVLMRQIARFEQKVFQRAEELAVKMRYIIRKMRYQVPEAFFWLNIFLPANMTIPSVNFGVTIQTNLFLPFS